MMGKVRAALIEAHANGGTICAVASALGVGRQVAYWESKRLGLKFKQGKRGLRPKNAAALPLMAALYRDGYTLEAIGKQFGVTRERVRQLLTRRLGVTGKDGGGALRASRARDERRQRREADSLTKKGCTLAQLREIRAVGRQMMADGACRERTPVGAYVTQRRNARVRGIAWELTLWQWWTIWQQSGRWADRGRGNGYVMCRHGDAGPYGVGNVFIATGAHNSSHSKNKKSALPTGVQLVVKGKYRAYIAHRMVGGKKARLGSHKTPELAHAAYLAAAPAIRSAA